MKLLALDTSSLACSVALQLGDDVLDRHEEQPREHTRLLLPMIRSLLHDTGVSIRELDAIVLGNGPGSFIGMRIATSVAQGLAHGAGLKIVPVSSLAAVAVRAVADEDADEIVVAQDAHMNQVYLGNYQAEPDGLVAERFPERLHGLDEIDELGVSEANCVAAGFGWERYPELLAANRDRVRFVPTLRHPRAVDLLALGAVRFQDGGAIEPDLIEPAYLRQKVAEIPRTAP